MGSPYEYSITPVSVLEPATWWQRKQHPHSVLELHLPGELNLYWRTQEMIGCIVARAIGYGSEVPNRGEFVKFRERSSDTANKKEISCFEKLPADKPNKGRFISADILVIEGGDFVIHDAPGWVEYKDPAVSEACLIVPEDRLRSPHEPLPPGYGELHIDKVRTASAYIDAYIQH